MIKAVMAGLLVFFLLGLGCETEGNDPNVSTPPDGGSPEIVSRSSRIPADAVKMTPQMDNHPPQLHSDEWEEPIPVPGTINTAGAEDSPFITPDGNTLYFFFTPDSGIPAEKQVTDGVTGIYVSHKENGIWGDVERVVLQDSGKLALDGCHFIQGNIIWFCSAREGYTGLHWFTAEYVEGKWTGWQNADFDPDYEVGELHIAADGSEVYFHSARAGGKGGYDIWVMRNVDGEWQEPENVEALNTGETEGWPFVTQDGSELWFLRTYMGSPGIFRAQKRNGQWSESELILSSFAGEPSLDNQGNIYFVHHYFEDAQMIEADIYVARNK